MKTGKIFAALILACLALSLALGRTALFRTYEDRTIDSRFRWRYRLAGPLKNPEIALIIIDDQTLLAMGGRWPVAWKWHALLLDALSERVPAVVAYDILFPSSQGQTAGDVEAMVRATEKLGDVVYPYYFDFAGEDATGPSPYRSGEEIRSAGELLSRFSLPSAEKAAALLPRTLEATLPIAQLARRASLGFANVQGDDADGVVRRMPLVLCFEGKLYPSFCLMSILRYFNVDPKTVGVRLGQAIEFTVPEGPHFSIPIDARGTMLIDYRSRYGDFHHALFAQAAQSFARGARGVSSPVDLAEFEGKLVLVGLTATGVMESHTKPTSLSPESPIIIAHANALSTILSRSFLRLPGPIWTTILLLAIGGIVGFFTSSLRAGTSLLLALLCLLALITASYALFFAVGLVLPIVQSSFMTLSVYTLITSYRYATEERQRRFYRGVLGKYLSRNVMELVLKNPGELKLGGDRRELTVLFGDVRQFSRFCEKSPVEEIAPRLNELHDRMSRIIWKHEGTLDKYIGDAIMAFWGAPIPQEDHALRAVLAALEMRDELEGMRRACLDRGTEPLSMGFGINTGTMVVGNMGSRDLWNYTVIGDEVNLGARLEELTRSHGVDIIISEFTYRLVQDRIEARRLGEVTVKGREKPVVIYELIGKIPG